MSSNARVKSLIGKMDATAPCGDGDNEAVAAFRFATKALKEAGLTWQDVAEKAFGASTLTPQASKPANPFSNFDWGGFAGGGFAVKTERTQPTPPPRKQKRPFNPSIHSQVDGKIRVTERRKTRAQQAHVVFTVESDAFHSVYLTAFGTVAEKIANLDGHVACLAVKPNTDPHWLPTATGCVEI